MSHVRPATRRALVAAALVGLSATTVTTVALPGSAEERPTGTHVTNVAQPTLGARSTQVLERDGIRFRDLDRSGDLTPYEDWRLSPQQRAADLVGRMTLAEKAGLMVHATLPTTGTGYDLTALEPLVDQRHIRAFITRLAAEPAQMAEQNNAVQALAEARPWGIPVSISSDPRNGFSQVAGQTVPRVGNTAFPDFIGMGAAHSARLVHQFGEVTRREYRAVGIHTALHPQADLATEPRWTRINGTFGSDPLLVKRLVRAYIQGLQGAAHGLGRDGVAAVVKHWAGYGAQRNGFDSHYFYGRYAVFPGHRFATHLIPYEGAFDAGTAGVMPTYSILRNLVYQGHRMEQVGAGFNDWLLKDLLRGQYGFRGVILSDWAIYGNCPQECRQTRPPAFFVGPWGVGMPWGVESLTITQRYVEAIEAGVDQLGNADEPGRITGAVRSGLLSVARVDASALRILREKFAEGLFENPYVDPQRAAEVVGSPALQAVGDRAQAASLTLLSNRKQLLPVGDDVQTVYLSGVSADAATARGLNVTDDPAAADLAIVRLSDPRGGSDLTDLDFTGSETDYVALQAAVDAGVPVVAVPKLDRPLVLTNVVDRATAVLASYGVSDQVLLQTLFGGRRPGGRLPFELPRSMAQVDRQLEDVPDDIANPLFPQGFGLRYGS